MPDWRYCDPSLLGLKDTSHARAGLMGPLPALAMAADPVLHEVIRNEIRWWVTRQSDLPETGCVSFQKRGKHGRLLFSQLWSWDGEQGDWGRGYGQPRSPMVPKDLTASIEAALKEEFAAKPQPASGGRPVPGSSVVHRFARPSVARSLGPQKRSATAEWASRPSTPWS